MPAFSPVLHAGEPVPCLVFSGTADDEKRVDLSKFNRVRFGSDRMTVSSTSSDNEETCELLYSLYHHLEINNIEPNVMTGIEASDVAPDCRLTYNADSRLLAIDAEEGRTYKIGIFDINGLMLTSGEISAENPMVLKELTAGVYVAVATDVTSSLSLKFIVK